MPLSQRIYHINTLFKTSGTNENFKYTLQIPQTAGFDRVVLLQAWIPNSFFLIQEGLNNFTLREDDIDVKIVIPPGNYSAKVFADIVAPLMTAASPNGWIYSISIPNQASQPSTGKFTFSVSNNTSQPSIICTDLVNEQLGFPVNSINTFVDSKLVSATIVNFQPESHLFIHSDIADNGDSDVLQEIYVGNTQTLSYVTYQCTAPELYSKALQTNKTNIFNFCLTNEKKQLMNLNGIDMQLTICLYKYDATNTLIERYIKYKVQNEPNA